MYKYAVIDRLGGQVNLETNDLSEAYARLQELDLVIEPGRFAIVDLSKMSIDDMLLNQI